MQFVMQHAKGPPAKLCSLLFIIIIETEEIARLCSVVLLFYVYLFLLS